MWTKLKIKHRAHYKWDDLHLLKISAKAKRQTFKYDIVTPPTPIVTEITEL